METYLDIPIPEQLPFFITAPGESDILFQILIFTVIGGIFLLGIFYLHLHSVPDHMAHKTDGAQMQIVGLLTLLALFTHNNLYWVAALFLAAINLPDLISPIISPLNRIARSLERLSKEDSTPKSAATVQGDDANV